MVKRRRMFLMVCSQVIAIIFITCFKINKALCEQVTKKMNPNSQFFGTPEENLDGIFNVPRVKRFYFQASGLETSSPQTLSSRHKQESLKLSGDIILGGMFPMHDAGDEMTLCGDIKEGKGIQRLEAMLYAIDLINADNTLLPNLTLGAHLLDTCSRDTYALEQSMEFVKSSFSTTDRTIDDYQCDDLSTPKPVRRDPVIGVIGAASSSVSVMVANILRLFQIPQISYASTSVELSDKSRFGFFSRVVPPDNFQAQVMVEIVKLMHWSYVSTVAEEGDYGEKGIEAFKILASKEGICIAEAAKIGRNAKPEEFSAIIEQLLSKPNARTVVLFVDEDNCRKLLAASRVAGREGHFLWLGSDSWGKKLYPIRDQEDTALGAITILPKRNSLRGFDSYFLNLKPNNTRNPWFVDYWQQRFDCTFDPNIGGKRRCTGNEYPADYKQEGLVPFVVDAVYAMAHAIQNLLKDRCFHNSKTNHGQHQDYIWNRDDACIREPIKGQELLSYIRKVSFRNLQGTTVKFNKDGDASGRYDIFQFQKRDFSRFDNSSGHQSAKFAFDYIKIGDWENEKLNFDVSKLFWPETEVLSNETTIPKSVCSQPCPKGQFRQFHEGQVCCWHCSPCRESEIISNLTSCVSCSHGYVPNEDQTVCRKLPVEYMKWSSPWTIVPAAFASLGIMATVFTFMTFLRFNKTPVIMASGRELCYILLLGIMLCYIISLLNLSKPTIITCTIIRVGLSLGLSICYSAILTKTNRISRIFDPRLKNGLKRPSYTSPRSQIIISICLVSIQLVFIVAWLIRDPPAVREVIYRTGHRTFAVLQCGISATATIISLVYNMILIVLCTTYAFKTRKIPENFNEAKYIGFTMYSTCIVWLAFIPIYFGTNNDFKIQIASLSMCISISAAVSLGCLFTPKIYICIFQPYKNTRHGGSATQGTFSSNSTSGVLRFARPTSSAGGVAAIIAATTAAVSASQHVAPVIVVPEASSGDVKTTSTTNGDLTSPTPEDEQPKATS